MCGVEISQPMLHHKQKGLKMGTAQKPSFVLPVPPSLLKVAMLSVILEDLDSRFACLVEK